MKWHPVGVGVEVELSICDLDLSAITQGFLAAARIISLSLEVAAGLSSPLQFPAQTGSILLNFFSSKPNVYVGMW
jgi:hypothetical protein